MGENHEIRHKNALGDGEFKLLGRPAKTDVRTISVGFLFFFFIHIFASGDENVKYFSLQVHCMSYT